MQQKKYGFIYIWYDRKHKRFYIGCHWGTEDDGYICSSSWMRQSYKRRPQDFKRRIISYTIKENLLEEEYKWLQLIRDEELGKKYYNLSKKHFGHWFLDENKKLTIHEKMSIASKERWKDPIQKEKISIASKERWKDSDYKKEMSKRDRSFMQTEEYKMKVSAQTKERWEDPEYKDKVSNNIKENHSSSEVRDKISKTSQERWNDPEYKAKMKKKMKEVQSSKEYKEKMAEITRLSWIKRKEKQCV